MTTTTGARVRQRRALAVGAAALAVVGVVALAAGLLQQQQAPPAPPAAPTNVAGSAGAAPSPQPRSSGPPTTRSAPEPSTRGAAVGGLDYSEPSRLRIPGIDVSSDLVDIGLDENGVMETPEPVDRAGWFTPSPPPGVRGATVVAGHVTWDQEPSVFFRLGELRPGDEVELERRDGVTVVYRVSRIGTFAKDAFPTQAVYAQPDRPELRLITCGGEFDEAAGRYPDNVVVWAHAVATRPA